MVMRIKPVLSTAFVLSALTLLSPALLSAAGNSSGVVGAIEKKYAVTETSTDHEQVTRDGTTMVLKCAGVYSTPASAFAVPDNQVEEGRIKSLNYFLKSMYEKAGAHVLQTNDKVYITKIDSKSDQKGDVLKFTVLTVEDIDSNGAQKKFGATLTFKFKKGYLDDTPPEDVEQAIEAILAPDTSSDDKKDDAGQSQAKTQSPAPPQRQAAPPPPAPPPAPPAAPAAPGATISIGESSTQVLQAMGMPLQMYDLGKKKTFVYKTMKIIFIDDKVSDVQ
jgi:hypothetical protein